MCLRFNQSACVREKWNRINSGSHRLDF
ncbi:hypothetical protein [Pseudoalteromonas sp. MTN2-4]